MRTGTHGPSWRALRRRRGRWARSGRARPALCGLATLAIVAFAPLGSAQDAAPARTERMRIILGSTLPQPDHYFQPGASSAPNLVTLEDLARIAGLPVRQHPVNAGVFDTGCAQCHRLSGPLPPGAGAPPDVFDRLPPPDIDTPAPKGFTRLTRSPTREEYPSWSPDGRQLVYEARDADGRYNLWSIDADGTDQRQLTHHVSAGWAVWHPDGRHLAYWAADADGSGNLWRIDVIDGTSQRLTHHAMTAWPQWSPDGTRLAYQARDEGGWTLRLLTPADGSERELTHTADATPSRPLWSPDGTELLYQSLVGTRFELTRRVFPTDAAGRPDYDAEPRRIATTTGYPIDLGGASQHPAWSPDGRHLAFAMDTLDVVPPGVVVFTYKTWTLTPHGTEPRLLVPSGTHADRSPTWNADGSWLAQWSWNEDLHASVWLIDANAKRRIDLTAELGGDSLYPAWSPDGSTVAFASDRAGSFDIWLADVTAITRDLTAGTKR